MKKLIIVTFYLSYLNSYTQNRSYEIDTIMNKEDSIVISVKEYIDSTLMESYHATWKDSIYDLKYGFLNLKKGRIKEFKIANKWNIKKYDWRSKYPGYRGPDIEPIIFERIE